MLWPHEPRGGSKLVVAGEAKCPPARGSGTNPLEVLSGYYLPQVTREKLRSSVNCAIFFACKPLLSGLGCDVRIESFRTHPGWGSGDNLVALSDVEQALVGLPARRGRTRSAAAQQCCCSSTARNRRFRGPAASTRIRSIAQEAREPPNRRSTSSSTLDGHSWRPRRQPEVLYLVCSNARA